MKVMAILMLALASCGGEAVERQVMSGNDDLFEQLKARYGTRPRIYTKLFNGNCQAERVTVRELPRVVSFINQRLGQQGIPLQVNEAELATNFIAEGGFMLLDENTLEGIDLFSEVGVDDLVTRLEEFRPYLTEELLGLAGDSRYQVQHQDELGRDGITLDHMTLVQALYANAALFATARAKLYRDQPAVTGATEAQLFFWTTAYYNARATAPGSLASRGLAYADEKWNHEDDHIKYSAYMKYNANWRTATYLYLKGTTLAQGLPEVPQDEYCKYVLDMDGDGLKGCWDEDCIRFPACVYGEDSRYGAICSGDGDCAAGEHCRFDAPWSQGFCTRGCTTDNDCLGEPAGSWAFCEQGVASHCIFHCNMSLCPPGLTCELGTERCVPM